MGFNPTCLIFSGFRNERLEQGFGGSVESSEFNCLVLEYLVSGMTSAKVLLFAVDPPHTIIPETENVTALGARGRGLPWAVRKIG